MRRVSPNPNPVSKRSVEPIRTFVKIDGLAVSDADFTTRSRTLDDGITALAALWRIADPELPCDFYMNLTRNTPRHADASYYDLDFDLPCLNTNGIIKYG